MLDATCDLTLTTTVTWPRPSRFTEVLRGRPFEAARFCEQSMDEASCIVKEQEMAGLPVVPAADPRFTFSG